MRRVQISFGGASVDDGRIAERICLDQGLPLPSSRAQDGAWNLPSLPISWDRTMVRTGFCSGAGDVADTYYAIEAVFDQQSPAIQEWLKSEYLKKIHWWISVMVETIEDQHATIDALHTLKATIPTLDWDEDWEELDEEDTYDEG